MEEKQIENKEVKDEKVKDKINELEKIFQEPEPSNPLTQLADLDLQLESKEEFKGEQYTTELLDNVHKLAPTLTTDQVQQLIDYVRGKADRPEFMDMMLTQTSGKLVETLRIMVLLQLLRLPALQDYLNALQKNMLNTEHIKDMSYEDISKEAVNVQKEISEILNLSLKVCQSISQENQVPTKIEKLASALMGISDATRQRIEEIIAQES